MTTNDPASLDIAYRAALDAVASRLDEALAALEAPFAELTATRLARLPAAQASDSKQHPDVRAFAAVDAKHARLESLIAILRDAQSRCSNGGR